MKRTIIFVLTALLLLTAMPAMAASSQLVQVSGSITSVDTSANQITVKLSDGSELVFNVDSSSALLSAKDGSALNLGDLAAGMSFTAFHSAATTRSLPPQSYLHTMIAAKSSSEDFAHNFTVQQSSTANGSTELINKEGDTILRLSSATDIRILAQSGHAKANASDIKAGARIIAWYEIMTLSLPAQANPTKVLIISAGSGDVGNGGNGGATNPPKTGDSVNDTMAVCAIVLSVACLSAWALRSRKEN